MASAQFAVAVATSPARALGRRAIASRSQTRQTNVVQTSLRFSRDRRSRLKSRSQSQLSLGSNISPDSNKPCSRDETLHIKRSRIYDIPCTLMMLTRLAVGLEPLNALDAAHRSPRSSRRGGTEIGFPADPALAESLSETKNCRNVQMTKQLRQLAKTPDAILHCRSSPILI